MAATALRKVLPRDMWPSAAQMRTQNTRPIGETAKDRNRFSLLEPQSEQVSSTTVRMSAQLHMHHH